MTVLSIDQSLSASGIIVWHNGVPQHLEVIKTPTGDEVIIRIIEIIRQLRDIIRTYKVDILVCESLPFGMNSTSVRPLAALFYFLQYLCINEEVTFTESHVTKTKKLATGRGNAKKADMILAFEEDNNELFEVAVAKNYKKTTGLADIADSYWIYKLHEKENE